MGSQMHKTEHLRHLLTEVIRKNNLEPKILEQRVFDLWRTHIDAPFNAYAIPVSLSDGILKIYTEYPSCKSGILFQKLKIIADLNAELEQPVLTDLRIELRPVRTAEPYAPNTNQSKSSREPSKPASTPHCTTPEELERIEQILATVTDVRLKKSLRQLFTTQSKDKP